MITNVCLLLEMLSIVLCLHRLYGEKFRFDIVTVSFLSVYMIIMTAINYYGLPKVYTMVMYALVSLYCGKRFNFNIKTIVINHVLSLIVTGSIQMFVLLFYYFIFDVQAFNSIDLLIADSIAFSVILLFIHKYKMDRISKYLQDKERILIISLILCVFIAMYCVIQYKKIDKLGLYQYVLLFSSISFICILVSQLGKYKIKSNRIETELKMHELYADSFHSLIEDIRLRQHEFDNHINSIYSQHYIYDTYEKLINAQKSYCKAIMQENRYNKLLIVGNPIVIGFLYGKFMESEKYSIDISYKVNIDDLDVGIPIYKLVEILGNLIDNAVEALKASSVEKLLYVEIVEGSSEFEIKVRNRSEVIEQSEIENFFKKGFSKKGTGRGLGLYNVKNICSEYSLNLFFDNIKYDNKNWLCFTINNKKEIILLN